MKTNTLIFQLISLIAFGLLLAVVGCRPTTESDGVSTNVVTEQVLPTPIITSTLPKATEEVKLPTSTLPQPTISPTIMPTNVPSPTAIYTPIPTNTPRPTLPPDEAQILILDLLENNAECQLPCWWGFIPGETNWQTAEESLSRIASRIVTTGKPPEYYAEVFLVVSEEISPIPLRHIYAIRNDIIDVIDVEAVGTSTYDVSQILSAYGPPEEVWLLTGSMPLEGDLPFEFALFYPQQGFMVDYGVQGQVQGEYVLGCPEFDDLVLMTLWSPEKELTFSEVISRRSGVNAARYKSLETATDMTIGDFFQVFKEADNLECLQTPAELWVYP